MPHDHPADRHLSQLELKLQGFELKPLHLLYLSAIANDDFDSRLHRGHFAKHEVFSSRINELIEMGLIYYRGSHHLTPRGKAHMDHLMSQRIKP